MENYSNKWCFLLPLLILGVYSGILWKVNNLGHNVKAPNEITTWTNGYLTNDTYLKCDIQSFVGENSRPPRTDIYFWIIHANSSSLTALKTKVAPGPRGISLPQVLDVRIYNESSWNIFPFSIHIPKAKLFFEQNRSWTLLKEKKLWDSYYIKFYRDNGGRKQIFEWYLDKDTHLTDKIQILRRNPNTSNTRTVLKVKESSVGIVDDNEIKVIGLFCTYSALLLLPFSLVVALYKNVEVNPTQKEKERIESREYRQKYFRKHKENHAPS